MNAKGERVVAGVDLGGTKIQAVVVGPEGEALGSARSPTPRTGGPDAVLAAVVDAVAEACALAGRSTDELAAIGVGSPGEVDTAAGEVSHALNLPDWTGSVPMAERLQRALGPAAFIGNDVQLATEAEFSIGAAADYDSLLGVFWGTGVGGGLILAGEPWVGRGSAGEIGHMVVRRGGALCPCGRRGCMEAYAGREAMERRARHEVERGAETSLFRIMEERGRERLTSGVWEQAATEGDDLALGLLKRAEKALAAGIASAVNLLDVEAVVIGGGMGVRFGERYVSRISARMRTHLFSVDEPPAIQLASLGELSGAIGAAQLASRKAT